jgi:hypothetical protein
MKIPYLAEVAHGPTQNKGHLGHVYNNMFVQPKLDPVYSDPRRHFDELYLGKSKKSAVTPQSAHRTRCKFDDDGGRVLEHRQIPNLAFVHLMDLADVLFVPGSLSGCRRTILHLAQIWSDPVSSCIGSLCPFRVLTILWIIIVSS